VTDETRRSPDVVWQPTATSATQRVGSATGIGVTVWLTGLSGAGKSTIAHSAERQLLDAGRVAYVLDGDNLRHGLSADLGFSAADRDENVRRVGEVAALFADAGAVAIVALISPYRAARDLVRQRHQALGLNFIEVFVDTPLDECRRRDPKGLYARSAAGELRGLSGVDDPYEPPTHPELVLSAESVSADDLASRIVARISSEA
jgi:bifunctional enzyme CysN/CysC